MLVDQFSDQLGYANFLSANRLRPAEVRIGTLVKSYCGQSTTTGNMIRSTMSSTEDCARRVACGI